MVLANGYTFLYDKDGLQPTFLIETAAKYGLQPPYLTKMAAADGV